MKLFTLATMATGALGLRGSIPMTYEGNTVHLFKDSSHARRLVSATSGPSFSVNGDLWVSGAVGINGVPDIKLALENQAQTLADETTARLQNATDLDAAITAEATVRGTADTALYTYVDVEITQRLQNATDLNAAINAEIADRTNADNAEIVARNTADIAETAARTTADNAEIAARTTADDALGGRIDTEVAERLQNATDLNAAINAEIVDRTTADTTLGGRIDTEVAERLQNATDLNAAINAEIVDRTTADTTLGGRIDTEVAERLQNATDLNAAINAEIVDRTTADTTLGGRIDTEVAERLQNATDLDTRITTLDAGNVKLTDDQTITGLKTFANSVYLGLQDTHHIEVRGQLTFDGNAPTPEFDKGIQVQGNVDVTGNTTLTGKFAVKKDVTHPFKLGFYSEIPAYFSRRAYVMPVSNTENLNNTANPDFTEFELDVYKPLLLDNGIDCDNVLRDPAGPQIVSDHTSSGNDETVNCLNPSVEHNNAIHRVIRRAQVASVGYIEDHGRDEVMFAIKVLYNTLGFTDAQFDSVLAAYRDAKATDWMGAHAAGWANHQGESTQKKFAVIETGVDCSGQTAGACTGGCVNNTAGDACEPTTELF